MWQLDALAAVTNCSGAPEILWWMKRLVEQQWPQLQNSSCNRRRSPLGYTSLLLNHFPYTREESEDAPGITLSGPVELQRSYSEMLQLHKNVTCKTVHDCQTVPFIRIRNVGEMEQRGCFYFENVHIVTIEKWGALTWILILCPFNVGCSGTSLDGQDECSVWFI